jgi:hypothetical protein
MTLALRLGLTLERMELEMPYAELVEWIAYFDLQAAQKAGIPFEHKQMSTDEIFSVFDRIPNRSPQ